MVGQEVELIIEQGLIKGKECFNWTGNQKNLVMIEFPYDGHTYRYPFSRKTGKLYACKLPFKIKLSI